MRLVPILGVLALAACGEDAAGTLLVDLRTDLEPGTDFVEVETRAGTRAPVLRSVRADDRFDTGARVAELPELAGGTHEVVVTLFTSGGAVLASRRRTVTLNGTTALLVVINRGCAGLDGCTWGGIDAGPPGGGDAGPADAAPDIDAGPTCAPLVEICNARDDDCDEVTDEEGCPCPVHALGGSLYMFCSAMRTWAQARADCAAVRYDLVVIADAEENETVRSNITGDTWIGLSDAAEEGTYVWVDGTPLGFTSWRVPDAPRGAPEYDCVEVDPATGDWLDVTCATPRSYACEAP